MVGSSCLRPPPQPGCEGHRQHARVPCPVPREGGIHAAPASPHADAAGAGHRRASRARARASPAQRRVRGAAAARASSGAGVAAGDVANAHSLAHSLSLPSAPAIPCAAGAPGSPPPTRCMHTGPPTGGAEPGCGQRGRATRQGQRAATLSDDDFQLGDVGTAPFFRARSMGASPCKEEERPPFVYASLHELLELLDMARRGGAQKEELAAGQEIKAFAKSLLAVRSESCARAPLARWRAPCGCGPVAGAARPGRPPPRVCPCVRRWRRRRLTASLLPSRARRTLRRLGASGVASPSWCSRHPARA